MMATNLVVDCVNKLDWERKSFTSLNAVGAVLQFLSQLIGLQKNGSVQTFCNIVGQGNLPWSATGQGLALKLLPQLGPQLQLWQRRHLYWATRWRLLLTKLSRPSN
jgi:hypothetical protein